MKHCFECKFYFQTQNDIDICLKQNIKLNPEDVNINHGWLEDAQEHAKELLPELWEEAIKACPNFKVETGRPTWMDDNDLLFDIRDYELGDPTSDRMNEWFNE